MAETPENDTEETTPAAEPEAPVSPPADEAGPAEGAVEGSPAAPSEPEEPKSPKERKASRRQTRRGSSGAATPRTPEERQAARDEERKRKAAARRRRRPRERERAKAGRTAQPTPPREHGPGRAKVRQGVVTSDKADKTITVRIDAARRHRRYEKIVRSSTTLHAHDETNDASEGDVVRLVESRPLSATKRWRLLEVLERAR